MSRRVLCTILVASAGASAATTASADPIDRVVAVLAAEELPSGLGVAEVHLPASLAGQDVEPGDVSVAWPQAPRAGRASARVTIQARHHAQRVWVPITIAALATVAVATRELAPGEVIAEGDVRREARAAQHAAPVPDVVGARVTVGIPAGGVIAQGAIEPPAPVARGADVTVHLRGAGFAVTAHGTLDRPARVGADVPVRLANRALVHGVLVDAGTVLVQGTP